MKADSLWGSITDYSSSVWDAWGKDADSYVDKVMETEARSEDELFISTALQDAGHNVAFAWHLLGSVISNEYTQERAKELGSALSQTEGYGTAKETIEELGQAMHEANTQFMQEHPKVHDYLQEIDKDANKAIGYIHEEATAFANKHPEISHDFQAIVEIASSVPAVKAGKVAMGVKEDIQIVEKLQYLDKAQKHPIEIRTATKEDLKKWQEISKTDKDSPSASWVWNNSFSEGVKKAVQTKSFESLKSDIGVQAGLAKALGQKPEFVQISTHGKPLGMMLMVKDYKNHITEENSGFVWYLQSTPKEYLDKTLDIDRNEFDIKPGAALLDTAAVKSLEAGRKDVMLHADPKGGEGLVGYYGSQKYRQVDKEIEGKEVPNITGAGILGRENDGRYFHQNSIDVKSYMEKNRNTIGQAYTLSKEETSHTFNKTDMALATAATVAIASETVEEEPFDSTNKSQEVIGTMFPEYQTEQTQVILQEENNTSYTNDLPESVNNYLEQFDNSESYGEDREMEIS